MHAEHRDLAGVGGRQAFADFDGGSLAGAVGPEEAEAFSAAHLQLDAIDGDHVFVRLAKMPQVKGGRRQRFGHTSSMASAVRGGQRPVPFGGVSIYNRLTMRYPGWGLIASPLIVASLLTVGLPGAEPPALTPELC